MCLFHVKITNFWSIAIRYRQLIPGEGSHSESYILFCIEKTGSFLRVLRHLLFISGTLFSLSTLKKGSTKKKSFTNYYTRYSYN